jgi:pimeloyl-ACP methyl ester carboxylesterase
MTETPVLFGPDSSLVGILTQPASKNRAAMAFLMFNAGVISRIGPHRLNVKLARALAEAGETSLRFDLSGQGDSRSAIAGGDFWSQAISDIRSAMDHLEQTCGIRRFALIGICSGAVSVFAVARVDPRVSAVLMFDGHWYRTRWTLPVRHWKRFRATSWGASALALRRRLAGVFVRRDAPAADEQPVASATPANPPRAEFVRSVQALVDRHVAAFFVYSGSAIEYYSYANQFRDAFKREAFFNKVRCDFCPEVDHTLISLEAQRRMIGIVRGWVQEVHCACAAAGLTHGVHLVA